MSQTTNDSVDHIRLREMPVLGTLPERFTVDVDRGDILSGIRESANYCPIARAVRRALNDAGLTLFTIDVDVQRVSIMLQNFGERVEFWHDSQQFVTYFDKGRHVEPRTVALARIS